MLLATESFERRDTRTRDAGVSRRYGNLRCSPCRSICRYHSKFIATGRHRRFGSRQNDQKHFRYGPHGMQDRSQQYDGTIRMDGIKGRSALADVCLPTDFTQNDAEVSE